MSLLNARELVEMYEILSSYKNSPKDVILNKKFHVNVDHMKNIDMISLVESSKSGLERDIMRLIYITKPSYTNDSSISNETFLYTPYTDCTLVSVSNQKQDNFQFIYTSTDNIEEVEFQNNTLSPCGSVITFMSYLWSSKTSAIVYSSNYTQDSIVESYKALKEYYENNK
ncbi:hypothetical protein N0S44_000410 [Escherichia coli]|nr:hypothetical protein [Escherichia coli]